MTIANKIKLNFRFHNPNTVEETANYIAKLFVEVNQAKVERVLQEAAEQLQTQNSLQIKSQAEICEL